MAQSTVDNEYRRLEAALKEARIPTALWEGIGDVWVDHPARAYHLIARFKDTGATPSVRLKQASADEFTQLGTQFEQALRDAAMLPGGDKNQVVRWAQNVIAQASSQQGPGGATTTKAARGDPFWDGVSDAIVRTGGLGEWG